MLLHSAVQVWHSLAKATIPATNNNSLVASATHAQVPGTLTAAPTIDLTAEKAPPAPRPEISASTGHNDLGFVFFEVAKGRMPSETDTALRRMGLDPSRGWLCVLGPGNDW